MTNGWSAMGFGLPAALAAKLCRPEQAVVCVTGDGGLLMQAGELATAARLGLPVVIVVLVDHSLQLIAVKQQRQGLPVQRHAAGLRAGAGVLFWGAGAGGPARWPKCTMPWHRPLPPVVRCWWPRWLTRQSTPRLSCAPAR
ncbi:MAG: hypothetical protein KatS3mg131_0357 [Candidatus Tectimicrobiota bacterium]|nr:MAG: hypothetical protein KatS3mg131_0357 [Candidatus Tectomicrobia bacterium]